MTSVNFTSIKPSDHARLRWIDLNASPVAIPEGEDVIVGLQGAQKTLPCRYLYDAYGSLLFEKICDLPEYYPTRTERSILQQYAGEIARLTGPCELVELGSGSSSKTRLLLDAYRDLGATFQYCPIDISESILQTTAVSLLEQYPTLRILSLVGTYEQALEWLHTPDGTSRLLIFLGSTLGNLTAVECDRFLTQIEASLQPGDYFLLGVDLQKAPAIIEAAYNDAQGVTAAFNLNALNHLNHRFSGNFQVQQFEHLAFYNQQEHRIEMHLRSLSQQLVRLEDLAFDCAFNADETIHTEISRKFHLSELIATLESKCLPVTNVWTDEQKWFGLILCQRRETT